MKSNLNKNFSVSKTETHGTIYYFVRTPLEYNITMLDGITSRCRFKKAIFLLLFSYDGFSKVILIEFGVELRLS